MTGEAASSSCTTAPNGGEGGPSSLQAASQRQKEEEEEEEEGFFQLRRRLWSLGSDRQRERERPESCYRRLRLRLRWEGEGRGEKALLSFFGENTVRAKGGPCDRESEGGGVEAEEIGREGVCAADRFPLCIGTTEMKNLEANKLPM